MSNYAHYYWVEVKYDIFFFSCLKKDPRNLEKMNSFISEICGKFFFFFLGAW